VGKMSGWADGSPPQGSDDIGGARAGVNKRFPHKGLIYLPHNAIINPCMDVSQRNLGNSAALTTAVAYAGPDRWAALQVGAAAGIVQQWTGITATGMKNALRVGRNAGSAGTGNIVAGQALETLDSFRYAGKRCTFSFRVATGAQFSGASFIPYIACGQGTDQSLQLQIFTGWTTQSILLNSAQTIAANAPWTNFNFQVDIPASTTQLGFVLYYTPSGTAGADDSIYLTDFRFYEANTDFTNYGLYRPYQQELAICQRYYEKSYDQGTALGAATANGICTGVAWATTNMSGARWKVEKRVVPTVRLWSRNGTANKVDNAVGAGDIATTVTAAGIGTSGMHRIDNAGGSLVANSTYEFHYDADSELG
jgi:hypothetical protein